MRKEFNRIEFTTVDNVAHVVRYVVEQEDNVVESGDVVSFPVAAWADRHDIAGTLITLCLKTDRW